MRQFAIPAETETTAATPDLPMADAAQTLQRAETKAHSSSPEIGETAIKEAPSLEESTIVIALN